VLLDKNGNPIMVPFDSSGIATDDAYVLDLNAPCPKTCANDQPLKAYH